MVRERFGSLEAEKGKFGKVKKKKGILSNGIFKNYNKNNDMYIKDVKGS